MSNACQKSLLSDTTAFPLRHRTSLLGSPCSSSSAIHQTESYNDPLLAKQRAFHLLKSALTSIVSVDIDVILAVVLLFIEFELIDSGRDNWRHHINGARMIIEKLCGSHISTQTAMNPLRSCLISNCLMYVGPHRFKTHPQSIHTLNFSHQVRHSRLNARKPNGPRTQ